jgi:Tol biopolymer transport system component
MLAAHVTAVPDPVEKYRAAVSPALAQIIMKCLAKKPSDRWQTAEEVLQHLEPLATPSGGTTPARTRPIIALGGLPRWAQWAAGVAAVGSVALLAIQFARPKPLNITISDVTHVTSEPGVEFQPAISPSGNEVAYVAGPIQLPHLGIRSTANVAGGEVRLADAALGGEWYPSWSPDGESVWLMRCSGAASAGCGTYEAGRLGGVVRPAGVPREALGGLTYRSPNGAQLAFVRADTVFTASASAGGRRQVAIHRVKYEYLHSLAWSPDGTRIAYVNGNRLWRISGNLGGSSIWIVGAGGGEPVPVTTSEHLNVSPAWLDSRHLLFVSDRDGQRAVYVVEVAPNGRRGEPRLVPGVADPHSISYSIGAKKLAYAKFILRQNVWSYPLGRSAPLSIRAGQPVTTGTQVIETHDVSPDGRSVVYDGTLRGHKDLYRMALGDAQATPLTGGSVGGEAPRWSPDGSEIAFHSLSTVPGSLSQIMVIPAEGGSPVALTADSGRGAFATWSPDGRQIAFHAGAGSRRALWLLSRDGLGAPWQQARPLTDFPCTFPDWAADGSALVCEVAPMDVVLVSSRGGRVQRRGLLASHGLRRLPIGLERFSRDGRVFYTAAAHRDGRRGIWAVPVMGGPAKLVIAYDDPALTSLGVMSVGPGRLYLTVSEYESDIWVARLKY